MPTIDLIGSTIRPQSRKSGKMYAKQGYDIKCHFTVKNTSSRQRSVWWAVHDHHADRRMLSGTTNLSPGGSRGITRYVTMPNHQVNLKFWAGTIDDGSWNYTDTAGFNPIYLKSAGPQVGYVAVKSKVVLGGYVSGAEIMVDFKGTGVYTPGTVSLSPGRHFIRIKKTGYIPGTGLNRDVKAGQTINLELSLVPVSVPKPVTCGISPGIRTPSSLPLKLSAAGIPTPPSSFMIHTTFTALCREAGKSIATPSGMPDLPITVALGGMQIKRFSTRGSHSWNALDGVIALLYAGRITKSMESVRLEVRYPKTIEFESKTSSGRVTQYDTFRKDIPLDIASVIPEVLCTIRGALSNPGEIPLTLPAGGFGIPTLDAAVPIIATFRTTGCTAPANLMDHLQATVTLNNQSPITIRPNKAGNAMFNLSDFSMPSISDATRTMELTMRFPQRMRCSTPTPEGEQVVTRTISVKPAMPGLPECVLMEADYFRCPDGTRIQINECMNGMKVPTGATCQITPPAAPPCVLTAADYFTCPDGAVIQINECVNGMKVPTGVTCHAAPPPVTPPPGTIGCVITAADYFTCPDGSVIQINECVNDMKVPTGSVCPTAPTSERQTKTVNVTTPMLIRVGQKVKIAGLVFCGTKRVGGEKAWISINGELLTTANTRDGAVNVSWNPTRPGLYNICITVPESSVCNASASACMTVQVVRELSTPEIEAAEEEFLRSKERIGELMERI